MKTFDITIQVIGYVTYTVEAEDQDSAEEKAWKQYDQNDASYSHDICNVEELGNKE